MRNYIFSLVTLIVLYYIHNFGMDGAYVRIWWLDILTHSMVSFGIALCVGGLIQSIFPRLSKKKTLIIAATFFVGFMWEGLEVYYNITGHPLWSNEYYLDTIKDLIVDTVAGTLGAYFVTLRVLYIRIPRLIPRFSKVYIK